jgi:hypothetical protein
MEVRQLHYTSCKTGPSGHSGFQFCAASPGLSSEIMREVEQLTVYEPPRGLRTTADGTDADQYPVNFVRVRSKHGNLSIIARVVYVGLDFSNRSGNYFAHSLVVEDPGAEPTSPLPVELWGSSFWKSHQEATTELPVLIALPPGGPITRATASEFIAARPFRSDCLAQVVASADQSVAGGPQVLIIESDSAAVSFWIALVCYLLGPHLVRSLTFATYAHDPRRCPANIVGTVASAGPLRAEMHRDFQVFDFTREVVPEAAPTSGATLLARLGVMRSPAVWQLADDLGVPPGVSLADCFPVLCAAALMLGDELNAREFDTALDWLVAGPSTVTTARIRDAVNSALPSQHLERLSTRRQEELLDLARRVDLALQSPAAKTSLSTLTEQALVNGMLKVFDHGERLAPIVALRTEQARLTVAQACCRRLIDASIEQVTDLLAWASAARVPLPAADVRRAGEQVVMPGLLSGRQPPGLGRVTDERPELREGMVDKLVAWSGPARRAALAGPAGALLQPADFLRHPMLGEDWLTEGVRQSRLSPPTALEHAVRLRQDSDRQPIIDSGLLLRLWPDRHWTLAEALQILAWLSAAEATNPAVSGELAGVLATVPGPEEAAADTWMKVVVRLSELAPKPPSNSELGEIPALKIAVMLIRQAWDGGQTTIDQAIPALLGMYGIAGPITREFICRYAPHVLPYHTQLTGVLTECPPAVFESLLRHAYRALDSNPHDVGLAARLYAAMRGLNATYKDYGRRLEREVLIPLLPEWNRREINDVSQLLDRMMRNGGRFFKLWVAQHKPRGIIGRLSG